VKTYYLFLSMAIFASTVSDSIAATDGFAGTWVEPLESTIPNTTKGDQIRYGKDILLNTYKYLGAESVIGKNYSGNKLACASCHIDGGVVAYAAPFSVVSKKYADPGLFSSRTNELRNLPIRINGCMERSLAGKPIPVKGPEMQAIIAYMNWLSTGMEVDNWTLVKGQGFISVPDLTRAADPIHGETVYADKCMICHGANGQGEWDQTAMTYIKPALWGPDSFNNGAGMNRLRTGVRFVKGNMPDNHAVATAPTTQLSLDDAWDVMAYVLSHDRQSFSRSQKDWSGAGILDGVPNWMRKPVSTSYPPYYPQLGDPDDMDRPAMFPPEQYKYGPYQPMLQVQKNIRNAYMADPR
jgi:thiosulfate dehydrogenase